MASTNGSTAVEQSGGPNNNNLGKDEVAWFFVEQYYTTLSKTPEKLHLFYSKRSQFVYGAEAEVADVSVGRQNIQERIKSLDLSDNCSKVRISNVDSQTSFDNIVIQVIGETSNRAGDDPKKFVQTFVLAQQPSGYFVLNDILRYLDEETEEEQQQQQQQGDITTQEAAVEVTAPAPAAVESQEEPEAKTEPAVEESAPATSSLDAGAVDQKLEEVATNDTASVNGDDSAEVTPEPAAAPEAETSAPAKSTTSTDPEETARQLEEEDIKEPEKPADPSPTPVATRQQPPAPQPAAPAQPPKPMTWASRLAAAGGPPKPVVPLPKTATPAGQPKQAAPAAAKPAAAPAQATEAPATSTASKDGKDEWQTAGSDSKKHNRIQSVSAPQAEKEGVLGYVKFVTEKVQPEELKAALGQYGEVVYLDINRAKSCAFVEFSNPAGYQAAAAANPHVVNGESITVEPRRPKSQAYGGGNFNSGRGNLANRGRGGFEGGRAGGQGNRGNFGGQNRGGRGGARGARGGAQASA